MSGFKLAVCRAGGSASIVESTHETVDQAVDQLVQVVAMRVSKRYRAKIVDDVRLYNVCDWKHRDFTMSVELIIG
ncbi:MAG: hypothetical protein WC749_00910 [Dehalococcoidia bacterium]|uniref:hypothetical protein n=1 Tax=unclassified Pseudomonas TaxID=196821 RepID=UPI0014728EF0|nr:MULTISPECIES: hypothetical protein [unclassified Pseudomonas]NMX92503.1 hypothetical protein [Pseudomonas sp. WS 5086]NMY47219.1 hypothetical protein [Pseudomonas sp. WS 5027]